MRYDMKLSDVTFPKFYGGKNDVAELIGETKMHKGEKLYVFTLVANRKRYPHMNNARFLLSMRNKDFLCFKESAKKTTKQTLNNILGRYRYSSLYNIKINKYTQKLINELTKPWKRKYLDFNELLEEYKNYQKSLKPEKPPDIPFEFVYSCPEELPEGIEAFIWEHIIRNDRTLVYKKGNVRGTCSVCGKVKAACERFAQGKYVTCPGCGERVRCVLENSASWSADYLDNIIAIQKGADGAVWFREWHIERDYEARYENVASWLSECARYVVKDGKTAMWTAYGKEYCWIGRRYEYKRAGWSRSGRIYTYDNCYTFYPRFIEEATKGTCLEYADIRGYFEKTAHMNKYDKNVLMYALRFNRYPVYEFLNKRGYYTLLNEKICGRLGDKYKSILYWQRKSLKECFKFPLRYLQCFEPHILDMHRVDFLNKYWNLFEPSEIPAVYSMNLRDSDVKNNNNIIPLKKALKYVAKQDCDFSFYGDYISECMFLNLDLTDEHVLFPKNLVSAHARTSGMIEFKTNPELHKNFKIVSKKLRKYSFKDEHYLIRAAASPSELKVEGSALSHCVGGYAKRMSTSECYIFFVRDIQHPNKPFYTLELRDKKIIQCRTKGNVSYELNKDVYDFCQEWLNQKVLR